MTFLLTRGRIPYLLLLALLVPWCILQASRVGVERDNESLVARDPTQDALYERFRQTFGSDEDLLVAVRHPHLVAPGGLQLIADLTARTAALPGVRNVYSLTNAQQIVAGDAGAEPAPLLTPPYDAAAATAALDRNPDLAGLFVSPDRRTAGILVEIEDRAADHDYRSALIHALRGLADETSRDGVSLHLTGIAVQTVLDTALLPRVVAEIRKKEEGNWPPDKPGHDDAARYVATLEQVAEQLRSQQPKDPHRTHRRLHLLIEFALDATQAAVAISGWAATDSGAVRRSEPVVVLRPARDYVRTNMRLIAADSFHVDGAALDALLAPLPQLAVETTACRPTLASASVPRMPRRESGRARPGSSSPAA